MSIQTLQDLVRFTHERHRSAMISAVDLLDTREEKLGLILAVALLTFHDMLEIMKEGGIRRLTMRPKAQQIVLLGTAFGIVTNRADYQRMQGISDAEFNLIMKEISDVMEPLTKEVMRESGGR